MQNFNDDILKFIMKGISEGNQTDVIHPVPC